MKYSCNNKINLCDRGGEMRNEVEWVAEGKKVEQTLYVLEENSNTKWEEEETREGEFIFLV